MGCQKMIPVSFMSHLLPLKAISMKTCNNLGSDNCLQRAFPPVSHPEKTLGSTAKYLLFLSLYLGQSAPVGFTWLTIPVILRSHGISLGAIGMMALLYSPWALKFLYSSILERIPLPFARRRKGWIMITRVMALVTLHLLAGNSPEQGLLLPTCLILVMNFFFALSDLAVEGYATDILLPKEHSWGACLQITGNFAGFMVGGGIFLIFYHHLGWETTLWMMACFILLLTLPMAFHKELTRNYGQGEKTDKDLRQKPHPLSFVARPQTRAFFVLLIMAAIYTLILRASVGPQSATDYGILCGAQHLTSFCAAIAAGYISQALGYGPFYLCLPLVSLALIFPVKRLFAHKLHSLNRTGPENSTPNYRPYHPELKGKQK